MRMNCGVVAFALECFAQHGFGIGEFVLLVVNPSKAIEISAIERLFLKRALNERLRLVEPLTKITEHITVVVEHVGVVWVCGEGFLKFLFGAVIEFLPLVNGAEQGPRHYLVAGLPWEYLSSVRGLFGLFIAFAAFIYLGYVEIAFAVCFGFRGLRAQGLHCFIGLLVVGKKQSLASTDRGIVRVLGKRFLAGLQGFRQILCRAISVHDEETRATVLFIAKMAQFVEGENSSLIILALFVKLAELLIQNGEGAAARRQHRGLAFYAGNRVGEDGDGVIIAALCLVEHGLVVHDL